VVSLNDDPEAGRRNRLLGALPKQDYERLLPQLERTPISFKQTLLKPNEASEYVYFLLEDMASLVTALEDEQPIEVATISNEGTVALSGYLGSNASPM